jgi:hypothetical protein
MPRLPRHGKIIKNMEIWLSGQEKLFPWAGRKNN